ncbi:hypothetical protein D3C73_1224290 [compost metagenome]
MIPGGNQGQVADRLLEFDADHQALAANRQDVGVVGQLDAQFFQQPCSLHLGVLQQPLFLDDLQHSATHAASQRVAAEGAAVAAGGEQFGGSAPSQASADRDAVAKALGQGHHVRDDAFVLKGEPLASAADTGLDFVEHEQPAVPAAHIA